MSLLLLCSSVAYLQWQVYEQQLGIHKVKEIQAYYTAQAAIIHVPLAYMRTCRPQDVRSLSYKAFPDGVIPDMGEYRNAKITILNPYANHEPSSYLSYLKRKYELSASGVVKIPLPGGEAGKSFALAGCEWVTTRTTTISI